MPATEERGLPAAASCLIALPCSAALPAAELAELAARGAGLFELRLDLSAIATAAEAAAAAQSFAGHRLIATCRAEREGGRPRPDAERLALLRACAPHADAIDIELSSAGIFAEAAALCGPGGPSLIVSHHDVAGTPPLAELLRVADEAAAKGAAAIKVATTTSRQREVEVLAELLAVQLRRGRRLAVMGMGDGEVARQSRVALGRAGSYFVYAKHGPHESAPGQPGLDWLAAQLRP